MTTSLKPGANTPVSATKVSVHINSGKVADFSAFRLYENGKTKIDSDFVFYGQKASEDGTIKLVAEGVNTTFAVDLANLKPEVHKVAFTATVDNGTIANLGQLSIAIEGSGEQIATGQVPMEDRHEAALILAELYRRNDQWKFRFVAQGFNGGLQPLAEHFGVNIVADPTPSNPPPEPPPKPVNLSKVSLTKSKPSVSLEKQGTSFGLIRVNLNWNQQTSKGIMGGLFGGGNKGVDLDLGAFVAMRDGRRAVIQALGNAFGTMAQPPYVQLQGDDRTGSAKEGEWLHINGEYWDQLQEVLVYAFIYEGAPNWDATDGKVTLYLPNQPKIETQMTEGNSAMGMCAIARLVNANGQLKVERVNQFFRGHKDMDEAFNWGFRWTAGSK